MREGTDAAEADGQVPKAVKWERNRVLRELAARKNFSFRQTLVGQSVSAVGLAAGERGSRVLSDNFFDVSIPNERIEPSSLVTVRIESATAERTTGCLVD